MQALRYKIKGYISVYNFDTDQIDQIESFAEVSGIEATEENVARAREIAVNGEYIIEEIDDIEIE